MNSLFLQLSQVYSAVKLLLAALENGDEDITWVKNDSDFDRIRDDERFINLFDRFSDNTKS